MTTFLKLFRSGLLLMLFGAAVAGCGKNDIQKEEDRITEENEEADTLLTPQELISTSLVQGVLGEEDEPALETYIENELYEELKNSKGATIEKLSSSTFVIEFESSGQMKSYLLKKFYNPQKDEFYFEKTLAENKEPPVTQ